MSATAKQKCKDRGYPDQLKKGAKAAYESPKSGPFETNIHAKNWVIQDPDGNIYNIVNLHNFFRENHELIPNRDYKQACAGFNRIKRTRLGKMPKGKECKTWYGWELITWGDDFINR